MNVYRKNTRVQFKTPSTVTELKGTIEEHVVEHSLPDNPMYRVRVDGSRRGYYEGTITMYHSELKQLHEGLEE